MPATMSSPVSARGWRKICPTPRPSAPTPDETIDGTAEVPALPAGRWD